MAHSWVIYKITSPSGRVYIGKTRHFRSRMNSYKCVVGAKEQKLIYRSIIKYGFENHTLDIIEKFESDNRYSDSKEMFWIRTYMSNASKYPKMRGLNLTDGGDGCTGHKMSDATKKILSDKKKSNKSEMYRLSLGLRAGLKGAYKGEKRPSWVGDKISKTKKGVPLSDKNRIALLGVKKSVPSLKKKPIIQFDLYGNIVMEHNSISEAVKSINGFRSAVNNVLSGKFRQYKGYIFRYKTAV